MIDSEIERVEIRRVTLSAGEALRVDVHGVDGTRASFDDRDPEFTETLKAIAGELPGFANEWSGWWNGFGRPPLQGKPVVLWDRGDGGLRKPDYVKALRKALGHLIRKDGFKTRGSTGWSRTEDGLASGAWVQSSSSYPGVYVNLVWDLDFPEVPDRAIPARPASARDFEVFTRIDFHSDAAQDSTFLPVHGNGPPEALAARLHGLILDGVQRLTAADLRAVGTPGPELLQQTKTDERSLLFRARYHLGEGRREEAAALLRSARERSPAHLNRLLREIDAVLDFLSE